MYKLLKLISIILLLTISSVSHGEIEKVSSQCGDSICFYWWPKLPNVLGWNQDRDQSFDNLVNAQAPDGFNFSNAETVIYARAIYKPREPEITSLKELIDRDINEFKTQFQSIIVSESTDIKTKDNVLFKSFTFSPKQSGNWEQVSYAEEGDFYLMFIISSRSKLGYDN